jgi:hypothetical protein
VECLGRAKNYRNTGFSVESRDNFPEFSTAGNRMVEGFKALIQLSTGLIIIIIFYI